MAQQSVQELMPHDPVTPPRAPLPVVDGERPIGIVSLGDLAIERDEDSALADSAAAPNQ